MKEEKHMSHLRNIAAAIEDKGYSVLSIKYEENYQVNIMVDNPGYAGNRAFLEKARDQEGQTAITREEFESLPPEQKSNFLAENRRVV
jgi:hypothetical protein